MSDAATFSVTSTNDSGLDTLRWAVTNANITPGTNTIAFSLTGSAPFTINLTSPLPVVTNPVVIDGTTQTGYADHPLVVLKGNNFGSGTNGLRILAGNSVVRGLAIGGFFDGIRLETNGNNVIQGNFLGTDAYGTNSSGNTESGIAVVDCDNNTIGGAAVTERNIVGANPVGVWILSGSTNNSIVNNWIGLKSNGTNALGNGVGVTLQGVLGNLIVSNVICGSTNNGIDINSTANGNIITGNLIGTDATGKSALPNRQNGIALNSGTTNVIGGTTTAQRNVISGNLQHGIQMTSTTSNLISGNYIGVDATGTNALGNGGNGILLQSSIGNSVGGFAAARNVISGNTNNGIYLYTGATGNYVQGNYIGIDSLGTHKVPNIAEGIRIEAGPNTIGGAVASTGNVISGNGGNGILLSGASATGNSIAGNFIGTAASGASELGNTFSGIRLTNAPANIIGGTSTSARNVISGNSTGTANSGGGISLRGSGSVQNQIVGNYIGTDVSGTAAIANSTDGIDIFSQASSNIIGGTVSGAGNLISGNNFSAIFMSGANGTIIQGNSMGTKIDGTNALGHSFHTIEITNCSFLTIGGTNTGAGNRIAFSQTTGYSGVRIRSGNGSGNSTNDLISGNLIFSNANLAIDLGAANVTANVSCNSGTSANANKGQNYPVLSQAVSDGASVGIKGTLNSTANTSFRVQFFANPTCAAAGNGQGQIYLGEGAVTTDGSCNASFTASINQPVTPGYVVTATATDPGNNTSEFSACVSVSAAPSLSLKRVSAAPNIQLQAAWPTAPAGFVLKQTTNLAPPVVWTTATNSVVVSGSTNTVTISAGSGSQFFRLSFE